VDVFYAGKMVERRNGAPVRDLTTTETETGSVYVVMPVPASVKKAITPTVQVPSVEPPTVTLAASPTTPRLANGKPDMTGNWNASGMNWRYGNRRCGPTQVECTRAINQTADFEFENPDFRLRSLRGNAVLRWEYHPGSTLYFVWQQDRSGLDGLGDFALQRDLGQVFRQHPDNVFVLKASYWIGK